MYLFSALQLTLLCWQVGEQVEEELSDSNIDDSSDPEDEDATESSARFITQEAYDTYARPFIPVIPG